MADIVSGGPVDKAIRVALTGLAARQRVISNNLANLDTPGFKASEVRFEDELQSAIARERGRSPFTLVASHPMHLTTEQGSVEAVRPDVVRLGDTTVRLDGNNVDIDREMVELAETSISYGALAQLISSRISLTKYIVNEGKR